MKRTLVDKLTIWSHAAVPIVLGGAYLAFGAGAASSATKQFPAQCVVMNGNDGRFSGPCAFEKLDAKGSFRVSALGGAVAGVRIGPLGKGRSFLGSGDNTPVDLGESTFVFGYGCWVPAGAAVKWFIICVWKGNDTSYRGPIPPDLHYPDASYFGRWIAFGERADMDAEVVSRSGLDTAHAVVVTRPSLFAAIRRCALMRETSGQPMPIKCIADEFQWVPPPTTLEADCKAGVFESFVNVDGPLIFEGNFEIEKGYSTVYIHDLSGRYVANPQYTEVSSYDMAFSALMALCPDTAKQKHVSPGAVPKDVFDPDR